MQSISSYVWDVSRESVDDYITFASKNNVSVLYVQYNEAVPNEQLAQFIRQANEASINVYALDGSNDWFSNDSGLTQFLEWVQAFQAQYGLLAGIHVDIEPYTLPNWASDKEQLLTHYIAMHEQVVNVASRLQLFSEASIPFWFDKVSVGDVVVSERLIALLDRVVVMAYRNEAKGEDGMIAHVTHEMNYAETIGGHVIVAFETHESSEGAHISFYGQTHNALMREVNAVSKHFNGYNSFHGVAIHHLEAWMALK